MYHLTMEFLIEVYMLVRVWPKAQIRAVRGDILDISVRIHTKDTTNK